MVVVVVVVVPLVWSFYIDFFLSVVCSCSCGGCRCNLVADGKSSAGLEDEGLFGYKYTLSLLRNRNISLRTLILFQVYFIPVLPLGHPSIFLPKFKAWSIPEPYSSGQAQTQ